MSLPNPTVTYCTRCGKMIRDERSEPRIVFTVRYDTCASCRAELASQIRTGVEFTPLVEPNRQPSLPTSSQAAASPVPDSSLAEAAYQAFMRTPHKGFPRWEGEVPPLSSEDHPDEYRAWINAARAVRDALRPAPRDGITLADDDGESLVFDVHLVMTARTVTEDGARYWSGATHIMCGGSKTCASLDYRGNLHDYGLGKQLVDAIENEIAAPQPRKGDE